MFQMPAVFLSLIIATLCSTIFFVLRGRGLRQWALYWIAGLAGFFAGQWLATYLGWNFLRIGQVHLLEGIVLCLAACLVASRALRR